ncbi:MAG: F0F1 ATP synthase subunit alpha, partial [Verrucomicrobiae bacterium]|nr:F0F1 ATP synthase subunit alpha [Verrucomicrobiae bacterium]
DGQIFLETDLFNQGIRPAISVGLSVSRVGSSAQIKAIKQVAGSVKLELAQFRELQAFAQFGSDLDAKTKAQLDRGSRIVELFKQPAFSPKTAEVQVALLWAVQNGYVDSIEVGNVQAAIGSLEENLTSSKSSLLTKIRTEKKITDEIKAELKAAIESWKSGYAG